MRPGSDFHRSARHCGEMLFTAIAPPCAAVLGGGC